VGSEAPLEGDDRLMKSKRAAGGSGEGGGVIPPTSRATAGTIAAIGPASTPSASAITCRSAPSSTPSSTWTQGQ